MQTINWNLVYQQQAGKLVGTAYRYVKDRKQAEDIVQNSFVVAIEKASSFKGKGVFEAWLRRIVVNESLMFLRARKMIFVDQSQELTENFAEEIEAENDDTSLFAGVVKADFTAEELMETADLLPEHHRLVFYMYVVDSFSHKEIGEKLGISEGTSKSHLNRARKKLQELLCQKVMNKKAENKKCNKLIVWWLGLFAGSSKVDRLYARSLKDFSLAPPPPSLILQQSLSVGVGSVGLSNAGIALWVGGAVCVGSVSFVVVNSLTESSVGSGFEKEIFVADSLLYDEKAEIELYKLNSVAYDRLDSLSPHDSLGPQNSPAGQKELQTPQNSSTPQTKQPSVKSEKILKSDLPASKNKKQTNKSKPPLIIKKVTVIDTIYED